MSLTDEMMSSLGQEMSSLGKKTPETVKAAGKAVNEAIRYEVKGICLVLGKGVPFTSQAVMQAVKKVAFAATGKIQFSDQNIDIDKFQKNRDVKMVGEAVTAEAMKYFDRHCKQYGVKYSAVLNKKENTYTVFFEGKHSETILKVMQEAFKDYSKEMEKSKGKQKEAAEKPKERESVKAKLAFFRNRVKARDADREKDALEKNLHRSDRER